MCVEHSWKSAKRKREKRGKKKKENKFDFPSLPVDSKNIGENIWDYRKRRRILVGSSISVYWCYVEQLGFSFAKWNPFPLTWRNVSIRWFTQLGFILIPKLPIPSKWLGILYFTIFCDKIRTRYFMTKVLTI